MELGVFMLPLFIAIILFLWILLLHRRARLTHESIQRDLILSFQPSFVPRPPVWMAVRADPMAVQAALGLKHQSPCSWSEGMTGERQFFIGPPVNGWTIVTGGGLPNPSCDVDDCFRFLIRMSKLLGQVQFFQADRILHHHAWARAENGEVIRAYAWAGHTIWNQGPKTAAEIELRMKCFSYGEDPDANSWASVEWTASNVGKVPLLAMCWSLDPARINERARNYADGIAGESSRVD
jgi:hypothetical protein